MLSFTNFLGKQANPAKMKEAARPRERAASGLDRKTEKKIAGRYGGKIRHRRPEFSHFATSRAARIS